MDNLIGVKFSSFLMRAEPYMKTAHGTLYLYWDGIVHLALYLVIIVQYTRRESHRELSLFLCGSMVNGSLTLVYGALCGSHSFKWMTLYRIACIIIAVNATVYFLHNKPVQARTFLQFPSIWKRPVDCFFMLFFKAAGMVALLRGIVRRMAVLGGSLSLFKDYLNTVEPYLKDPSMFPRFQVIAYEFLFLAYYTFVIYGLMHPGQHWMSDWSILHAGAAAQAQFCLIGGALHSRTSKAMNPPMSGQPAVKFWSVNLLLFIIPVLFAFWCQRDPEKNGRSYTAALAHPIEIETRVRQSKVAHKSD